MTKVTHPAVRREAREIFRGVDIIKAGGKSVRWKFHPIRRVWPPQVVDEFGGSEFFSSTSA
jgi:hypothetical protein